MANTVPAALPVPDVGLVLAGQSLDSVPVAVFGQANNWAMAQVGSGTPRISQSYPLRGSSAPGTAIAQYSTNAANNVAEWQIPDTRGATSVNCYLLAMSTTGAAEVEWKSTTAVAATGVQLIGATWALHGPFALTIDATAGFETVTMYLDGNGDTIHLAGVWVGVPPDASPLAAAATSIGCIPIDASELAVDEPLASGTGRQIIDNVSALRDVPHVYWNWSGLEDCTVDGIIGDRGKRMLSVPHVMPCIVWADTDKESWSLTIKVRCQQKGDDRFVAVHACTSVEPDYLRSVTIAVPTGGARAWFSGTLELPTGRRKLQGLPSGWETVYLLIWPEPTATSAAAQWQEREGGEPGMQSTAEIESVSIWGR